MQRAFVVGEIVRGVYGDRQTRGHGLSHLSELLIATHRSTVADAISDHSDEGVGFDGDLYVPSAPPSLTIEPQRSLARQVKRHACYLTRCDQRVRNVGAQR